MVRRLVTLLTVLLVAGCGGSPTTPANASPDPGTATVTQGRFSLTFTIDRKTVFPADAITGTAALTLLTPGSATIAGSSTPIVFEFQEVGGENRHVIPAHTDECAQSVVAEGGITSPITKTGAVPNTPDADWYRQFFADPKVHLPAGDWDITAWASFDDGHTCTANPLSIRATVRVHVNG